MAADCVGEASSQGRTFVSVESGNLPAMSRYDALRAALKEAVLEAKGALSRVSRETILKGEPLPGLLGAYVTTVREHAWRVSDEQVAALRAAGHTEDELFEATVSAALGASLHRFDRARAAMEAADAAP